MLKVVGACAAACVALVAPATAAANTKTIYAGGPASWQTTIQNKYGAGVDNFLINRVTINVGDTVAWNGKALAGGFHSVDFPGKSAGDLPLIKPTGKLVSGVNDPAGNPFWFNGKVPAVGFNPSLFAPIGGKTYNGSQRVDSGLPVGKPADFKLRFTKAGVYKYFCDVHPGMVGYVVVLGKGKTVPNAKQDKAELAKEEAAFVKTAKHVDQTNVSGNRVSLGASGAGGVEVFAMFPAKLSVAAGTTVTFSMSKLTRETHTATFGPNGKGSYVATLANSFAGPAPSAAAVYPSDPGTITLNATSHGIGFANTGALDRDAGTPLPSSARITFTAPGTYHFICLVHPFMHGTIIVK